MWLFEIVSRHWVLWLAALLYITAYTPTVRRFFRKYVSIRSVGHRIERLHLSLPVRAFTFVVLFAIAPYLWYELKKRDEEDEIRRIREEAEQRRRAAVERSLANTRREELRREWLKSNPITLYYNTANGITVVMTPAMYEANRDVTQWHRRNALWDKEVLMPDTSGFLFLDAKGREMFIRNSGNGTSDPIGHNWVSGWLTSLDHLVHIHGIKFEQKTDIFVPFVNNSVLPFKEHKLNPCPGRYEYALVLSQTPPEMHPIDR